VKHYLSALLCGKTFLPTQSRVGLSGGIAMAKPATWSYDPKSLKDAAYQAARSIEGIEASARYVLKQCPTFSTEQSEEVMEQLNEGWLLRHSELNPPKTFFLTSDGKNWVLPSDGVVPEKAAKKEVGVHFAMSFTPQAFGTLKTADYALYQILLPIRTAWSKYKSNRKGDLLRQIKKIERDESGEVIRHPTKAFEDYLADTLSTMITRCKNAKSRGDDTANLDLLNRRIAAFKAVK
jgi:hypothetical protein